jgi:hypothetical protein
MLWCLVFYAWHQPPLAHYCLAFLTFLTKIPYNSSFSWQPGGPSKTGVGPHPSLLKTASWRLEWSLFSSKDSQSLCLSSSDLPSAPCCNCTDLFAASWTYQLVPTSGHLQLLFLQPFLPSSGFLQTNSLTFKSFQMSPLQKPSPVTLCKIVLLLPFPLTLSSGGLALWMFLHSVSVFPLHWVCHLDLCLVCSTRNKPPCIPYSGKVLQY